MKLYYFGAICVGTLFGSMATWFLYHNVRIVIMANIITFAAALPLYFLSFRKQFKPILR